MTLILSIGLLAGCTTTHGGSYCDINKPVYFSAQATVDWLAENDPQFLRNIVINNETYAGLCGG